MQWENVCLPVSISNLSLPLSDIFSLSLRVWSKGYTDEMGLNCKKAGMKNFSHFITNTLVDSEDLSLDE